jgi:hypothetical protein
MDSIWPREVVSFEAFLGRAGLVRQRIDQRPEFGNKLLQCGNAHVAVRIISDRGIWYVEVTDVAGRLDEWYDAGIVRDLLLGSSEDVLTLRAQIEFVEAHWSEIVNRFAQVQRDETHARLKSLRAARTKRQFPDLHFQESGEE